MTKPPTPPIRITREQIAPYLGLVRQMAQSRAEATFLAICTTPGWDRGDLEEAAAAVIVEIERIVRASLQKQGGDPDGDAWVALRQTIAEAFAERLELLDAAAGPETQRSVQ